MQAMTHVERIFEFADLPAEPCSGSAPPPGWPAAGALDFRGVTLRYAPGLQPALRGLSLSVAPRERVGIAGRTGAGKSSLAVALFRFAALEAGSIVLDGQNLGQLKLSAARGVLGIIPQARTGGLD